jgi:hypothetical protein
VPAYFVNTSIVGSADPVLQVVSLATSTVTATQHAPAGTKGVRYILGQPGTGNFVAVAVSDLNSAFVFYRFRVTDTGQISRLVRIRGIALGDTGRQQPTILALSPDGSQLAYAYSPNIVRLNVRAQSMIVVLNLRSGRRTVWRGSLADPGYAPIVRMGAWTNDGRTLEFATYVCKLSGDVSSCFWEFRGLSTATSDGRLAVGPIQLRQPARGIATWPAFSTGGASVVEVRDSGQVPGRSLAPPALNARLVQVSLATGSQTILHRWSTPEALIVSEQGNFFLIAQVTPGHGLDFHFLICGWVDGSGFHRLDFASLQ